MEKDSAPKESAQDTETSIEDKNADFALYYGTQRAKWLAIAQMTFLWGLLIPLTLWRTYETEDWLTGGLAVIAGILVFYLSRSLWARRQETRPVLLLSKAGFASPAAGVDWQSWDLLDRVDLGRRAIVLRFRTPESPENKAIRMALADLFGFMVWFRWHAQDVDFLFTLLKGGQRQALTALTFVPAEKLSPRANMVLRRGRGG